MNKFYLKIILTFLLSSLATHLAIADVKAYLNKSSFFEGDPITLKIESSTNNNAKPDFSPLEKDFTILGTSTNSQISIMNGVRSFKKSWTIELQPNKKGILTIPEITVGNEKTQAVKLEINDLPPEVTAETKKHVFIESSIDNSGDTTYVQQQIPYTVKLFYDDAMQTAQIQTPVIKNAIIEKLGEDKRYSVMQSGKRFNVVEKHFVISPEKSGVLRIPPAIATGRIALSGGDSPSLRRRMDETDMLNNFFNDFRSDPFFKDSFGDFFSNRSRGPSKPFSLNSQEINVEVLPIPDTFTGSAWLPAEDLTVTDSWAKNPPNLKVGEPVTRTLTLQVKGLAGSQIPDINFPKPEHIKSYPDKATTETRTDGNTVYGIQTTEISYIPNTSGKVTIPKITIDWWDVKNKKQRSFVLPEWNLNVAPDPNYNADKEIGNDAEAPIETDKDSTKEKDEKQDTLAEPSTESSVWKFIIALPLLLLLLAYFIFRSKTKSAKQQKSPLKISPKKQTKNIGALRSALLQACKNNDKQLAATTLIEYAQADWGDDSINSLGKLASQLAEGSEIIKALEQSLYSKKSQEWNGKALAQLIEKGLKKKQTHSDKPKDELTPLYPI